MAGELVSNPVPDPERRLNMTFYHAECWDIRARARKLQQLSKWQEESAVVERWVANCASAREPSRLALGRYIREHWLRELKSQNATMQSKPGIADQWQPPGPELLEESRFRCYEGPIGFVLDVISQWHKELAFVLRFLHAMDAAPAYHPIEYILRTDKVVDTHRVPTPTAENRGGGGRAVRAPTRAPKEGTSSAQPLRAQNRQTADPPAPIRREERPTAGDSHYAPRAARTDVGCEGCGRRGLTAERCKVNKHPNWNVLHATMKWKDTTVAQEIKLLANGEVRSLPPDGVQWIPADKVWIRGEQLKA
jgi:hypothetical protein